MNRETIGDRGQWILALALTQLCPNRSEPYFFSRFLGSTFPTHDFYVELVDHPSYFFFVQVKTTTKGYTLNPVQLKVQVSQTDVDRMVACPVPTYVIGIDEKNQDCFLLSVNESRDHIASLPTTFKIGCDLLAKLADEVKAFWSSRNMVLAGSRFK